MFNIIRSVVEGVVGPFFSFLNKREEVKLEEFKVDGNVDIQALQAHVEALKMRRDVLMEAMKYQGIRFFQYWFMTPLAVWWSYSVAFSILNPYFPAILKPLPMPGASDTILAAVVGFLFLASKIDEWRRKT